MDWFYSETSHFRVGFCLFFKTSPRTKVFIRNGFDLHENERVSELIFIVGKNGLIRMKTRFHTQAKDNSAMEYWDLHRSSLLIHAQAMEYSE